MIRVGVVHETALAHVGYVEVGTGPTSEGDVYGGKFLASRTGERLPVTVFRFGGALT
jgi:hypothetical protein